MHTLHTISKMRRWTGEIVFLCVLALAMFSASAAQAQTSDPVLDFSEPGMTTGDPLSSSETNLLPPTGPGMTTGTPLDPDAPDLLPPTPLAEGGAAAASNGDGASDSTSQNPIPATMGSGFLNGLYGFVLIFFGWLVVWSAGLFNYGINHFTIGFADIYLSWGIGFAVEQAWGTVRDLFNLTFIFGLIYIGFRMILFADDTQAKRTLGYLIAAALLVNFSLFITKFIIDIANSLTTVIFQGGFGNVQNDIGSAMLNLIGLSSVFNLDGNNIIDIQGAGVGAGLAVIFGTMLFLGTAAFVFAAGGILLIVRAIVLVFLMIFSPIMFLGWVFPGMASYSKKYWKIFLGNVFMAPAYLFCIYVSFRILEGFKRPIDPQSTIAAAMVNQDSLVVIPAIMFFVLAIVLLVASISVAKSMGAVGAGTALSIGNNLRGRAQGFMFRNTAGYAAQGAKNVAGSRMASKYLGSTAVGREIQRGAYRSFDSVTKYGAGGTSLSQSRSERDATNKDMRQNRVRIDSKETASKREKETEEQLAALKNNSATINELEDAMNGLGKNIREMSNDERADLGIQTLTDHHVASNLTDAHIDNLASSGNYSTAEIAQIKGARKQAQTNIAETGFATTTTDASGNKVASNESVRGGGVNAAHQDVQRRRLVAGGNAAIGNLPVDALTQTDMLPYVTPRIVEERMRNGISEQDRIKLRDAVTSHHDFAINPATGTATLTGPWTGWQRSHPIYADEFFRP